MSAPTAGEQSIADLLAPLRADPAASAVLSDIDGTLAPIVADPAAAAVPEPTRELLRRLAASYGLVACVTGRRVAAAREMVGLPELAYAGNQGLERLLPGESEVRFEETLEGRADGPRRFIRGLDGSLLDGVGLRVEDKGPVQVLHWRGVADQSLAERRAREIAALAEREGLVPHFGRKALEVRPLRGIHKGTAVRGLVAGRADIRRALFAGDDATDLLAFEALRLLEQERIIEHAVCIGIASDEEPPRLAYLSDTVVEGPAGLLAVLEALAEPSAAAGG